jgi:tricorn protease
MNPTIGFHLHFQGEACMKKALFLFWTVFIVLAPALMAQIDARMFQAPDVSETHIVFGYAGDLWIVPKTGGTIQRSPA